MATNGNAKPQMNQVRVQTDLLWALREKAVKDRTTVLKLTDKILRQALRKQEPAPVSA